MIYDGIQILAQALSDLNHFEIHSINCDSDNSWQYGTTLINYIRQVQHLGLTGFVAFGDGGFRSELTFDILAISERSFDVIGQWENGVIEKTHSWKWHSADKKETGVIRVTTMLNDPFMMNTKHSKELKGNARYEGFVVDLMAEIGQLLNLRFEINLVKDSKYGAMINATTNEWSGESFSFLDL